jgi:hypothetical protein
MFDVILTQALMLFTDVRSQEEIHMTKPGGVTQGISAALRTRTGLHHRSDGNRRRPLSRLQHLRPVLTDFGPVIANPNTLRLGASAQLGVYIAFFGAIFFGFSLKEAASIGIIGGADDPTTIHLARTSCKDVSDRSMIYEDSVGRAVTCCTVSAFLLVDCYLQNMVAGTYTH